MQGNDDYRTARRPRLAWQVDAVVRTGHPRRLIAGSGACARHWRARRRIAPDPTRHTIHRSHPETRMKRPSPLAPVLVLALCLPLLAACQNEAGNAASTPTAEAGTETAPQTALGRTVAKALDEARKDLREGNLSLNGNYDVRINGKRVQREAGNLPAAEITPAGDIIIAGRTVTTSDDTRALARTYREGIITVAETGMDLGVQGADLGMRAAGEAIGSLLRGNTEDFEKRIEAEAKQLEASAIKLCDHLPDLLAAQQSLAVAVPEFAPYARMEASDIGDCKDGISSAASGQGDAAAEADAAAGPASTH